MNTPTVSVIIATHNRHEELGDLLQDLAAQDVSDFEVLVVDSAVAEDSRPIIDQARESGLDAKHLLAPNVLSSKRNHGVAAARGSIVIILDDDLRVGPHFVATHADTHADTTNTVASGPITFPTEWVKSSNYYRFKEGRHAANNAEPRTVPPHRFVAMNHSLRKETYLAIGGYDEDYQMYGGEDLDFGHRAKRHGCCLVLIQGGTAEHREVKMSWETYLTKVHKAAYFGMPLVLDKNPEAKHIPTVQVISDDPAQSAKIATLKLFVRVCGHRSILRRMAHIFQALDHNPHYFTPRAYLAATLIANRIGMDEHKRGNTYASLF